MGVINSVNKNIKKIKIISDDELKLNFGIINDDFRKFYQIGNDLIGKGNFGEVKPCKILNNDNKEFVVKIIDKKKINEKILINEILHTKLMNHPNIVNIYEVYEEKYHYNIITEYLKGWTLKKLINNNKLNEEEIKKIIFQILTTVYHIHSKGIIHRDIKPDNFIFLNKDKIDNLNIVDFGLSLKLKNNQKLNSICGTPYFMSPELINKEYEFKTDIWSIGVTFFNWVTKDWPFKGENEIEIFKNIRKEEINFDKLNIKIINKDGIDLLKKLLIKDPNERISIYNAINCDWFKEDLNKDIELNNNNFLQIWENIINKKKKKTDNYLINYFKYEIIYLLNNLDEFIFFQGYELFRSINKSKNGMIIYDELKDFFKKRANLNDDECKSLYNLFKENFFSSKDYISFHEFLVIIIPDYFFKNKKNIKFLIDFLKIKNIEELKLNELIIILKCNGIYLNKEMIEKLSQNNLLKKNKITLLNIIMCLTDEKKDNIKKLFNIN